MTTWFNAPTDKFPFAKIGSLVDGSDTNSTIEFTEGIAKLTAKNQIDCFLYAVGVSDCKKAGDSAWKFEPVAIHFTLHSEAYEKWGANKSKTTVTPTAYTRWLFAHLHKLMESESHVLLKGKITFTEPANSMTAEMLLSGKKADGSDIPDTAVEFLSSQLADVSVIDTLQHLKLESLPDLSKSGSYGGYSKGETTAESLQATKAFLMAEFAKLFQAENSATLGELAVGLATLEATDKPLYDAVIAIMQSLR